MALSNARYATSVGASFLYQGAGAAGTSYVGINQQMATNYPSGTNIGAVNVVYTGTRTVATTSSADVVNLSSLVDLAGNALSFTNVAAFAITNNGTNPLYVGGLTNGATFLPTGSASITLPAGSTITKGALPGSTLAPVVAGLSDRIQVGLASGSNTAYTLTVLGG